MTDKIVLTLDGVENNNEMVAIPEKKEEVKLDVFSEDLLSHEEKLMVKEFSEKIDLTNSQLILEYGSGVQKKMSDFSDKTLEVIKTKDLGEVGNMISNLVVELKNFDVEDSGNWFTSMFKSANKKKDLIQARYSSTETNVNSIVKSLKEHQITLMKDISILDQMFDLNKNYYKEISMYILAGKKKLQNMREVEIPLLTSKANESKNQDDIQTLNDLNTQIVRFEKKVHDLELSRTISLQTAPQIRMVQNNNVEMVEKIQSTIVNTIPLWKNQMVLAIGMNHSNEAIKTQKQVSDFTNELLKKNADALKMATVEAAKESERGIVDIETLRHTNQSLISSLDEMIQIQTEGRKKRMEAEVEIQRLESELKNKMIEVATRK